MNIYIDDERYTIDEVHADRGPLPMIEADGEEFYLAENAEKAGEAAAQNWRDMAEHDPSEFRCIVGDETIIAWALGQYAGPGSEKVNSLEKWLDVVADHPEEEWAHYDGAERDVTACPTVLSEQLEFTPTVAYRCN